MQAPLRAHRLRLQTMPDFPAVLSHHLLQYGIHACQTGGRQQICFHWCFKTSRNTSYYFYLLFRRCKRNAILLLPLLLIILKSQIIHGTSMPTSKALLTAIQKLHANQLLGKLLLLNSRVYKKNPSQRSPFNIIVAMPSPISAQVTALLQKLKGIELVVPTFPTALLSLQIR